MEGNGIGELRTLVTLHPPPMQAATTIAGQLMCARRQIFMPPMGTDDAQFSREEEAVWSRGGEVE